jgi:selenocysteine lyase/cysteine desulfurase
MSQLQQLYYSTYGHPSIQTPFGSRHVIGADTTASGMPNRIIESIIETQILPYYANTHSNAYEGRLMSHYIDESKEIIRKSVNARPCDRIIFTGNGCSGAINHLIHCLNLRNVSPKDTVVFISKAEHHSNHLPWTHIPVKLVYIPLLKNGLIDIKFLHRELENHRNQGFRTLIGSLIATSNVTGVHQKVNPISQLIHQYGGLVFWDYAASAPYIPIDVHFNDKLGQYCDAIFISTHKFFGGVGTPGILIAHQDLFKNNVPYCPGGGTVRFVCPSFQTYIPDIETKETGGTPNIIGSIKAGLAFDLKTRYQSFIFNRDRQLVQYVQSMLLRIPNLKILNPIGNLNRQPIFIFMIDQVHYNYIVILLNDLFGIQTRGGISCCSLLAQDILKIDVSEQRQIYDHIASGKGVPSNYGWCRVSFHYTMPDFIVQYILRAIEFVANYGVLFKKIYKYYPQKNNWSYCPGGCPWDDFSRVHLSLDQYGQSNPTIYLTPEILGKYLDQAQEIKQKLILGKMST